MKLTENEKVFLYINKQIINLEEDVLKKFYETFGKYFEGITFKTFKNRIEKIFENDLEIKGKLDKKYLLTFVKCLRMLAKESKYKNLYKYDRIIEKLKEK